MAEESSPAHKVNIAAYFIQSSPTAEVQDVVKDVQILVNDTSVLSEEKLDAIMQQYNTENMIYAPAPSGDEVMVSVFGQVDSNKYLDPNTGRVLIFDHRKQQWVGETDQKQVLPPQTDEMRVAVATAVKSYVDGAYHKGKAISAVYASDDGFLTVCISSKNTRLSSYWTGSIRSSFRVDVSKQGSADLAGHIKINVHYFEEGNVQLNTTHQKTAKVQVGDAATTAKNIVSTIDKIESEFQGNLEELYVNMHSNTFKAMRRFLPISGQPMNWNPNVHSLASEVTK